MAELTVTMFDYETGGLEPSIHQITEVGMLNFDLKSFKVNWEYQTFIQPYGDYKIDPIVYEKTMVTENDVRNGKDAKLVKKEMIKLLKSANSSNGREQGNTIMAGHNVVGFDRRFTEEFFRFLNDDCYKYISREHIDTLPMAKQLWIGDGKPMNLGECCKRIDYKLVGAHGAMADVRANFELFKYITNRMRNGSGGTVTQNATGTKKHRKFFNF